MKFLVPVLLSVLLISATGCCRKEACPNYTAVNIYFQGFALSDVDTVMVTGYKKGSNLSEVTVPEYMDSVTRRDSNYLLNNGLAHDHDWGIYIPATGKFYHVYDYNLIQIKCRVDCMGTKKKFTALGSFRIDDKIFESINGTIYK